jgi:hypothetical protein
LKIPSGLQALEFVDPTPYPDTIKSQARRSI